MDLSVTVIQFKYHPLCYLIATIHGLSSSHLYVSITVPVISSYLFRWTCWSHIVSTLCGYRSASSEPVSQTIQASPTFAAVDPQVMDCQTEQASTTLWHQIYKSWVCHLYSINTTHLCSCRSASHGSVSHTVSGSFVDVLVAITASRSQSCYGLLKCQHNLTTTLGLRKKKEHEFISC